MILLICSHLNLLLCNFVESQTIDVNFGSCSLIFVFLFNLRRLSIMFELTKFIANPTQAELFQVNRVDLMKIAAHYKVSFLNTLSKRELQVLLVDSLHKQGVFGDEEKLVDYPEADEGSSGDLPLQIKKLELQAKEHDRVLFKEREEWECENER